jgi:hypothetical protein
MHPLFVGDWLTETDKGFQRYKDSKFRVAFEPKPVDEDKRKKVVALVERALMRQPSFESRDAIVNELMKLID